MPIEYQKENYEDGQIHSELNSLVSSWFKSKYKEFSPPQKFAIVNIRRRVNTLVSSPTGSGKTLSAFLGIISELYSLSEKELLKDQVYCVYVSPLKALTRDIERNLAEPLQEMGIMLGKETGIRIGARNSDTTASEKAKMLRKPPHILITTPESLVIMLTSKKFREHLKKVEWCIIDEIHAIAQSKRGVHLSLTLERLQELNQMSRIGLSATISPLEKVAEYLVGKDLEGNRRDCKIVDVQYLKEIDLKVLSPAKNLIETKYDFIQNRTYEMMDELIQKHKTTLIFTNTRAATERVVHHLKRKFPRNYMGIEQDDDDVVDIEKRNKEIKKFVKENKNIEEDGKESEIANEPIDEKQDEDKKENRGFIGAHHGSLSKELRVNIETKLKEGKIKAVVCSTSLELGIDIGYVDLVILLGSPKSIARALQRIGRSGHKLHEKAKGRIIVLDRDDLIECSVLLKGALEKKIDTINIPKNALDVLAQQIFGIVMDEPKHIDDVYKLVKCSYCYEDLEYSDYMDIIRYLSGEYAMLEDRRVYAKIWVDEETRMMGKRGKLSRVLFLTNVGTIPDETNVKVKIKSVRIGTISEPFLEKLKRGDVFVLGGETYEFLYSQGVTAFVKASIGRAPTVPSWFSEMLPLSFDLAMEIQKFRRLMNDNLDGSNKENVLRFINEYLYVDENSSEAIYNYFIDQYKYSVIPNDKKIVVENFTDGSKRYAIYHTLYGRRVNDVLSRAVGFAIGKMIGRDVEVGINDNGFYVLSNKPIQSVRALNVIKSEELRNVLDIALEKSEVLGRRFRHCAARALMILRQYKGRRRSVGKQQMSSRLLIKTIKDNAPNFPILREAKREILEDLMDVESAIKILKDIENEKIEIKEIFTEIPTPFAFNLIVQGYSDILKMEDKYEFLKRMHEMVKLKIDLKERRSK